jgi:hypothetical protein
MPILVQFLISLVVVGVLVWAFNTFVTAIDPRFKSAINAIIGILLFIWFLYCVSDFFGWGWFGGYGAYRAGPLPRCR